MRSNPYSVLGVNKAKLRGRNKTIEKIARHLKKPTPDHVSVVGPKFIGKTVFLQGVKDYFRKEGSPYKAALYWDVRHETPINDQDFYRIFLTKLGDLFRSVKPELAEMFDEIEPNAQSYIRVVFELLRDCSEKILVILDGLDAMMRGEGITRNLWDYLRSLAELPSLRFVTGSRRRLRDLCASPESRTSDFWNIFFDTPITIGPFDEDDWSNFLTPFSEKEVEIDSSAQKELRNWTGGVPILAAAVVSRLFERHSSKGIISKQQVDDAASQILIECQDHLDELWHDCTTEEQGDLWDLATNKGEIPISEISPDRRTSLEIRGYVQSLGNRVNSVCRLMETHAKHRGESVSYIRRVFGDVKRYESNIKSFLELRLSHLEGVDPDLKSLIGKAIRDLSEPEDVLVWIRSITDCALDLVWQTEIPTGEIPIEWTTEWKDKGVNDPPSGIIPSKRGNQCKLLRFMVDPRNNVSTRISQSTYLLIDHIQSAGDFGQHRYGEKVPLSFAVVTCLAAIELCEQLAKDLGKEI